MFCALLGHTGERLQDHWSSGFCLLGDIWNLFLQKCLLSSPLRFICLLSKSVN